MNDTPNGWTPPKPLPPTPRPTGEARSELYALRPGNAECGHVSFDAQKGIKVTICMNADGETTVEIQGIKEKLLVVEGLPLTLKMYQLPTVELISKPPRQKR